MDKENEQNVLSGRCIAVTRPKEQAHALNAAICAAGGVPLSFPLIGIDIVNGSLLEEVIAELDQFDLAFFVSPNAVRYAFDAVTQIRTWPETLAVAAVGEGSAQALMQRGFEQVIAPERGFDSEAVLDLPAFSAEAVKGKRIVVFRGEGGRNLFGMTLTDRGASVTYATCYRRYTPEIDPQVLVVPASQGKLDALLFTSGEGVRNLVGLVGEVGLAVLQSVPVFAAHERIAVQAQAAGFSTIIISEPGDERLMSALLHFFDRSVA